MLRIKTFRYARGQQVKWFSIVATARGTVSDHQSSGTRTSTARPKGPASGLRGVEGNRWENLYLKGVSGTACNIEINGMILSSH
jgi:hypothetical protein